MSVSRTPQADLGSRADFFSHIYDDMTHVMLAGGWLRDQYLEPIIKSGITSGLVLEVGSGPGYLGLEWLKNTEEARLRCLDINQDMISAARQHAIKYGLLDRVEYIQANASKMPFKSRLFDAVFTNCSLHEWAHPKPILNEIDRVLKPDGRYCIVDLRRDMSPRVKQFLWVHTQPEAMRPTCLSAIEASYTANELTAMLTETKLRNWTTEETFWGLIITGRKAA